MPTDLQAKTILIIVTGGFVFFGILSAIVSFIATRVRNHKIQACTVSTTGTIIENRAEMYGVSNVDDDIRTTSYHPVVQYCANGMMVTCSSVVGSSHATYLKGQTVPIKYDPDDPQNFYIEKDLSLYRVIIRSFIAASICCFAIAVATFILGSAILLQF